MKTLFLSLFFASTLASASPVVVDRIVAVVNNDIVTLSDIRAFEHKLSQNGMIDDLLLLGGTAEKLKSSKKDLLAYLIHERIMDSEVKRLNLSVTAEKVEQEIRDIAKRNHMTRNEMLEAVRGQGMKVSDYQDFIKSRIERQSLIEQEVTSKIRVTDEDVQANYIRSHPESSVGIYEYTLANIVMNSKKGGVEAALQRANRALAKIKAGESFESVAEQTTEDPNFSNGGLLGSFKAGEFAREFEDGVRELGVGEVTKVIKSRGNFYILKVLNRKMISDPAFDREKDKIRNTLFDASFQKNFRVWLDMKKDESYVKINVSEYL